MARFIAPEGWVNPKIFAEATLIHSAERDEHHARSAHHDEVLSFDAKRQSSFLICSLPFEMKNEMTASRHEIPCGHELRLTARELRFAHELPLAGTLLRGINGDIFAMQM